MSSLPEGPCEFPWRLEQCDSPYYRKEMSKVTSKRQVTIPREVADRYQIEPGDEIEWVPSGSEIRVIPSRASSLQTRLGIADRLALFDRATERRDGVSQPDRASGAETAERGWTREEIYRRGRTG